MRKIVIYNQKGGVGKTTLAVNLASLSALSGRRTLLVDVDPQANSTNHLMGSGFDQSKTIADFFEGCLSLTLFRQPLSDFTTATGVGNLSLVMGTRDLEDIRNKLENKFKINKLKDGLRNISFDTVFMDPPPANDFFSLSCLIAADEILVPIDCDAFSIHAARDIMKFVEEVKADHNPELRIAGVIVNQFQKGTKHSVQMITEMAALGLPILQPFIPTSVKVRESHSEHKPLVVSYPTHPVSMAMAGLFAALFEAPRIQSQSRVLEANL